MKNSYFDISPLVSSETAVFPGDQEFERKVAFSFEGGDHMELSSILTTLHIGAHADAPSHYRREAQTIDQRDPVRYIGKCQVIAVRIPAGARIRPEHLQGVNITASRVLFASGSYPDPDRWEKNFNSLSPELIEFLAGQGVSLVGIDTPSVDPVNSKDLESHQMLFEKDMAVLEGLVLSDVPAGEYILMALPLKLREAEASPVRALLWPLGTQFERL